MNKLLIALLLLIAPFFSKATSNEVFEVEHNNDFFFVRHIVLANETVFQLAHDFSLKPTILAKANNIIYSQILEGGQELIIPLIETNFYKIEGISTSQKGFEPVYYNVQSGDDANSICNDFSISKSAFEKWNEGHTQFNTSQKIIVGWLKYAKDKSSVYATSEKQNVQIKKSNSVDADELKSTEDQEYLYQVVKKSPKNPIHEIVTKAKNELKRDEPKRVKPQRESFQTFWTKVKNTFKPKEHSYKEPSLKKETSIASKTKGQKKVQHNDTDEHVTSKPKTKKTFKEFWNNLVNGKDYVAPKSYSKPLVKTSSSKKYKSEPLKQSSKPSTNNDVTRSYASSTKKEKKSIKERWNKMKQKHDAASDDKNNQAIDKTSTTRIKKEDVANVEVSKIASTKTPKAKKSFKTFWNNLVNGKDYVAPKSYSKPLIKSNATKQNTITPNPKISASYTKSSNALSSNASKQNTMPKVTNVKAQPVLKKADVQKIPVQKVEPKITSKVEVPTKKDVLVDSKVDNRKEPSKNDKASLKAKQAEVEKQIEDLKKEQRELERSVKLASENEKKQEALNAETSSDEVEIPTVRSEIKSLSLTNTKTGKCSYFFSGPKAGLFYAFTNLTSKGEIVKVVNSQNGKFVMAEVIGGLSGSDFAKGILIKLSDNAKMPLGQKNSMFGVKVNY